MNFKNKRPRCSRAGCLCGGKYHKKITGEEKTKYLDPPTLVKRGPTTKNRRRWCKGKKGILHVPSWVMANYGYLNQGEREYEHQIYECVNCGKNLGWRTLHYVCGKIHAWNSLLRRKDTCEEAKAA